MKFLILLMCLSPLAKASTLTCVGEVDFYGVTQKFSVSVEGQGIGQANTKSHVSRIEVRGASLEKPNIFLNASDYWDGHANGIITAPGFSMIYENVFGCMRNVVVTTDFRGDVKNVGQTIGHVTQSHVIAICDNGNQFCH